MSDKLVVIENLYVKVKNIIENGRGKAFRAVNSAMIESYWNIGKEILIEEQNGENRAEYGKDLISSISDRLTKEYGKGYSKQNLWYIRQFYMTFPILHSLRGELSWTHYRLLMRVRIFLLLNTNSISQLKQS